MAKKFTILGPFFQNFLGVCPRNPSIIQGLQITVFSFHDKKGSKMYTFESIFPQFSRREYPQTYLVWLEVYKQTF